mgnify:CR=1 FL=1
MSIDVVLQFNLKMVMKMKQILLIALTLLFFIPIPFVQAVETGILFRREVPDGKIYDGQWIDGI